MDALLRDLHYTVRGLRHYTLRGLRTACGFALVAVVTLALGIGAETPAPSARILGR